jgi:hypothetical protein
LLRRFGSAPPGGASRYGIAFDHTRAAGKTQLGSDPAPRGTLAFVEEVFAGSKVQVRPITGSHLMHNPPSIPRNLRLPDPLRAAVARQRQGFIGRFLYPHRWHLSLCLWKRTGMWLLG